MNLYASNTTVDVGKTQTDIRKLIEKYGGEWIGVITNSELTRPVDHLLFKLAGLPIKFIVHHPLKKDEMIQNKYNTEKALKDEYRRRWREIWLIVKSRLIEMVQLKRDVQEVFMAQLVTKTGQTIWEISRQDMGLLISGGSLKEMLQLPEGRK